MARFSFQTLSKVSKVYDLVRITHQALYLLFRNLVGNVLGLFFKLFGFRIGLINQSAIGHLTFDTEVNYLESLEKRKQKRDLWYLFGNTTNQTISKFWTNQLRASGNPLLLKIYSAIQPKVRFQSLILNRNIGAGDGTILDDHSQIFKFTENQNMLARVFLEKIRIELAKPLILFCLRDNAYYKSRNDTENISLHSHRNVDVSEYIDSIMFFLSRGYSVVRMGRQVEKEIAIEHKNFIDLPFAKDFDVRTIGLGNREILELALFARCKFVISTGLGMDSLATLFRKRVYLSDFYSLYNLYSSKLFPLFLPKGYFSVKEKRLLTPEEVFNSTFLEAQKASEFETHEIELVNCSKNQLLEFMSDIFNLESYGQKPTLSKLALYHAEFISKHTFRSKPVPQLSDYWLNNI